MSPWVSHCFLVAFGCACHGATPVEGSRPSDVPSVANASPRQATEQVGPAADAPPPQAPPPQAAASSDTAPAAPTQQAPTQQAPKGNGKAAASGDRALAVLIDSKFPSLLPDQAKQKLAQIGEVREKRFESAGSVDFYVDAPGQQFVVEYLFDSGRGAWGFSDATVQTNAADSSAAAAIYEEHEQALRKRFGKPAWVDDEGGAPSVAGWSTGRGGMEVSLRQEQDERGQYVVRLHYGEVQGEPE